MKDQRPISPLKRIFLIFLTISALSVTSSWLTSCSETANAASDHIAIENRLTRIEAKIGNPGDTYDPNATVQTMATLTSKLSDDIGLMAERIVETEYLIVQVITNQTTAAEKIIDKATNADGTPMLDKSKLPQGTKTIDLLVLNQILKGHSSSNGVLLTVAPGNNIVTATNPPNVTFTGIGGGPYILLISTNGIFDAINSSSETINVNNTLTIAWTNILKILGSNVANTKVYFAVKTVAGGQLSAISNTLNVMLQ